MGLFELCFICFVIIIFVLFVKHIKSLYNIKKIIGIFWFLLLGILLYGMFFETTRGFMSLFQQGFWIIICIFLAGITSVFAEKQYTNISIIYFLFWYFTIPIFYTISVNYSVLKGEITLQIFSEIIFYTGFFLFSFVSIYGFISYIKEKYKIFMICFVACLFFYFPFLFVSSIVLRWIDK